MELWKFGTTGWHSVARRTGMRASRGESLASLPWVRSLVLIAWAWTCIFVACASQTVWGAGAAYSNTSADPDERAAADLYEALQTIEARLRSASMDQDPNQDRDLLDAVAKYAITHKQLADNAKHHQIPPPDLNNLRAVCKSLADRHQDDIARLKQSISEVERELQEAKALRQTLTTKIKANLALNLTSGAIEAMSKAVTIVGGAPSMGLSQVASLANELIVDILLPHVPGSPFKSSDADPNAGVSLQTQNQKFRQLYDSHKQVIDQRIATWIYDTYFTSEKQALPLRTSAEYVELLKKDGDKRAALQRRFLEEMRQMLGNEIIPGREDLLKQQKKELQRLQGNPADPKYRSYYPQYKAICEKILGLAPWTLGKPAAIGAIEFARPRYSVVRSAGTATIEVVRTGGTSGAVTIDYSTADGSAKAGNDYRPASGTLRWDDGESGSKTFNIPIIDDGQSMSTATLNLRLANPTGGGQLGSKSSAELSITGKRPLAGPSPEEKERKKPVVCNYLNIAPSGVEVQPGRSVSFTAVAVYTDGTTKDVSARAIWQPAARYTAPADLKFNEKIKVTATYREATGECTGSTEIVALAPSWSPPLSHADELGARGAEPGPEMFVWYALCNQASGEVVYAKDTDPTQFRVMAGPFPGARNAEFWINQNCPRWRCTTSGACAVDPAYSAMPGWNVVCNKADLNVYSTRDIDLTRHWVLQERLLGAPEADLWIQRHCPARLCTSSGACASSGQPRMGGKWTVVCNRHHGGVGLTQSPDRGDNWVWIENLFSEIDARSWTDGHCPSWRCDRDGRCLPGSRPMETTVQGQPVELPPGGSQADALELYRSREATRQPGGRGGAVTDTGPGATRFSSEELRQRMAQPEGQGGTGPSNEPATGSCGSEADCPQGYTCGPNRTCVPRGPATAAPGTATPTPATKPPATAAVAPAQVKPSTPAPPKPPADQSKWIVWHPCGTSGGWWCSLILSNSTEARLRAANKTLTILGSYASEKAALTATCAQMTGFFMGGEFVPGRTLAMVSGVKLAVANFVYWDSNQKKYLCRDRYR
jgi:Calx-beta domain-containing protein